MKRTIEIDDNLSDIVHNCIETLKEKIREHDGRLEYNYIQDDIFDIADSNTPVYTYQQKCIVFLHPEVEDAFDYAGIGEKNDKDFPAGWRGAAIACYLEQAMQEWLQEEAPAWVETLCPTCYGETGGTLFCYDECEREYTGNEPEYDPEDKPLLGLPMQKNGLFSGGGVSSTKCMPMTRLSRLRSLEKLCSAKGFPFGLPLRYSKRSRKMEKQKMTPFDREIIKSGTRTKDGRYLCSADHTRETMEENGYGICRGIYPWVAIKGIIQCTIMTDLEHAFRKLYLEGDKPSEKAV